MPYTPALTNLSLLHQGKTRDTFAAIWPEGRKDRRDPRLIFATDRLSTHNIVHQSTVPKKGEVLTALTVFWFLHLGRLGVRHHLLAFGNKIYDYLPGSRRSYPDDLHLRAIIVETLDMVPVEFIFRAYLCGSLWDKFYSKGLENPYGIAIPKGLSLMTKFSDVLGLRPVFTPTDKSEDDDPIQTEVVRAKYPAETNLAEFVFVQGRKYLEGVGLVGIDSKFELGIGEDKSVVLADEVWTLDSSRVAKTLHIRTGLEPPWLDKQLARDEAIRLWAGGPRSPLKFSDPIVAKLSRTYENVFKMITGDDLRDFQSKVLA